MVGRTLLLRILKISLFAWSVVHVREELVVAGLLRKLRSGAYDMDMDFMAFEATDNHELPHS